MTKRHQRLAGERADLDQKRKDLGKEGVAIGDKAEAEKRPFTETEKSRRDAILAELETLDASIATLDTEIAGEARLAETRRAEIAQVVPGPTQPAAARPTATVVDDGPFRTFGEMLQAVAAVSYQGSVNAFGAARVEEMRNRLMAYQAAASGMSVGVPSDGGYLVRKDWTTDMLDRALQQSILYPLCREIQIGADADGLEYPFIDETSRADGQRWGGVQVFWRAEAAAVTAKQPKIGRGELRLEEIMGLAYATERLLRDASALQGVLTNGFESEFAFKLDDSILRGTGSAQMLGILTSPALVTASKKSGQTADTFIAENVGAMFARMPARSLLRSRWFINQEVFPQLDLLTIGNYPIYLPNANIAGAPFGTLKGRPILPLEQCSAIGDVGDVILADFSEYLVIVKSGEGLRYDTSMHVKFLTDEMAFRWVRRINGQPIAKTAVTPFKGSASLSPFVTLEAR